MGLQTLAAGQRVEDLDGHFGTVVLGVGTVAADTIKNNEITTRVHEERKHNISFFSIPAQFPLNAFFLRFSYAYLTAKQYHTDTTC